jgi:hypothetical protein
MVTKTNFLITVVISAAVAALIIAYSAPTQAGGLSHGGGKAGGIPNIGGASGTQPQAGTGTVGNTTVTSNYDGKHGEKVTTASKNSDGSTTYTTKTYDANGHQTGPTVTVTAGPPQ